MKALTVKDIAAFFFFVLLMCTALLVGMTNPVIGLSLSVFAYFFIVRYSQNIISNATK